MGRRFRVIRGGKDTTGEAPPEGSFRLFRARSTGDLQVGDVIYHDVQITWYCQERRDPLEISEEWIEGYEQLPEMQRKMLENELRRCLTANELRTLSDYLERRYGLEVTGEEVALPMGKHVRLFDRGQELVYDFVDLSEKESYPLPFSVWGFYTLEGCLSSPSLEQGIRFLDLALERLNLRRNVSRRELENAVKSIFDEERLLVKHYPRRDPEDR